jgi:hypothetical protein
MPATALFLVVATVIGAVVVALIIWVTARRHSVGQRFEMQIQLQRGTRPHPVRTRAGAEQ